MIDLSVTFNQTKGIIVETYNDGDLSSIENVELSFDFSKTTSDELNSLPKLLEGLSGLDFCP